MTPSQLAYLVLLLTLLGLTTHLARRLEDRRVHLLGAALLLAVVRGLCLMEPLAERLLGSSVPTSVTEGLGIAAAALGIVGMLALRQRWARTAHILGETQAWHERRVRHLLDATQEGIWAVDTRGRTTFANSALQELTGVPSGELVGRPLTDFLEPDQHPMAERFLARGADLGPRVMQTTLRHRDGRRFFVRLNTAPVLDEHGVYTGSLATVVDISETLRREQDLRAVQGLIESIARGAPMSRTLDQLCRLVEARCPGTRCSVVLRDEEQEVMRSVAGPSLPEAYLRAVDGLPVRDGVGSCGTAMATGRPVLSRDLHEDPNWRPYLELTDRHGLRACWSFPVRSAGGVVLGSFALYWERPARPGELERVLVERSTHVAALAIERERIESRLERVGALLRGALDACPAGIVVVSPTGHVQVHNRAAEEIIGQELHTGTLLRDQARWTTNQSDGSPLPTEETPTVLALDHGRTTTNREIVVTRNDGYVRRILSNAAPVRDAAGRITSAIAVFTDVTDSAEREQERERLSRALARQRDELEGIFRATSHDLLSPLVNIKGFTRELDYAMRELRSLVAGSELPEQLGARMDQLLERDVAPSLKFVLSSVEKMERLLAGLKALTRTGMDPVEPRDVDMDQLLTGLLSDLAFQVREARARVERSPLPPCHADPDLLARVLTNLIDNALKYRHPGRAPVIRIEGERHGEQVELRVSDNGLGIPEAYRQRVFEPFERPGAGSDVRGEGLGLTIVASILQRSGGGVRIEDAPTGGACFVLHLPAAHHLQAVPVVRA